MKLTLSFFIAWFVFSGCISERKCNRFFPPKDTIRRDTFLKEVIVYRDSLIQVPADSGSFAISDSCPDDLPETHFKTISGSIKGSIKRKAGKTEIQIQTEPPPIRARLPEIYRELTLNHVTERERPCPQSAWNGYWRISGQIFNVLVGLLVLWFILRNFTPFGSIQVKRD